MKNLPDRSMDEIFNEFRAAHGGPTIDRIRTEKRAKGGGASQEVAWSIAKASAIMLREGWGYNAIGRFFNRGHFTIMYHNPKASLKNGKSLTS